MTDNETSKRTCPKCGRTVHLPWTLVCPYCGAQLK